MTDERTLVIGSLSEEKPPIPSRRLPCEECGRLVWISDAWEPGTLASCNGCVKKGAEIGITEQTYREMAEQGYSREDVNTLVKEVRHRLQEEHQ